MPSDTPTTASPSPSKEAVQRFLDTTTFSGYQSLPLPFGLRVPGRDLGKRADRILGDSVRGKSVLDIGTYYGYFPYEARRRGATRAAGIEMNRERYEIARQAAEFNGGYEILLGDFMTQPCDTFDVVLLLNVLHHVTDPVQVMRRVTELCREQLIVEFCLPHDPIYIERHRKASPNMAPSGAGTIGRRRARIRSALLKLASAGLPIMAIGDVPYSFTFYFTPEAFYNLFVVHHQLFARVEFERTVRSRVTRMVARCTPVRSGELV